MGALYVYTTEGTCLYPDDGRDDPGINRYFESVNFVVNLKDTDSPSVEAYFRATLPSGRPEQLFLRFQGDDPRSLLADCRAAIRRELVDARDWEIQQTTDKNDPSILLQHTVLRPPDDPTQLADFGPLRERFDRVRGALNGGRQVEITGRNYEAIAGAVLLFSTQPVAMAVTDADVSADADLVFSQERQKRDLAFTGESRQLVESAPELGDDEYAEPTGGATGRGTADARDVEPPLSLSTGDSTASADQSGAEAGSTPGLNTPPSEVDQGGRGNGLLANVSTPVLGGAIALVLVVALVGVQIGALSGGGNGVDGGGSSPLEIENMEVNGPIEAGENVTVEVNLSTSGGEDTEENIEVTAGEWGSWDDTVTVPGNEPRTVTAELDTTGAGSGEYTVNVSSGGETLESDPVIIEEPILLSVDNVATNAPENKPLDVGDELEVTVTLENTGEGSVTEEIEVTAGELGPKSQDVTVSGGGTESVTETFDTTDAGGGEYPVSVSLGGRESEQDTTARLVEPPNFEISLLDGKASSFDVDAGDSITLPVKIENTGGREGELTIDTDIGPQGDPFRSDSRTVTLEGGDSTTETINFPTDPDNAREEYDVSVVGDENSASATTSVSIQSAPYFEVDITDTDNPTEGEELVINAEVTNDGTNSAFETTQIRVEVGDGFLSDTKEINELDQGNTETLKFILPTSEGDAGNYDVVVSSEDDKDTTTVTIEDEES